MPREWYFVRQLGAPDGRDDEAHYEVQVLNEAGQAAGVGRLRDDTSELTINGLSVPRLVIEAAKKQAPGKGDYVGPDGKSTPPF